MRIETVIFEEDIQLVMKAERISRTAAIGKIRSRFEMALYNTQTDITEQAERAIARESEESNG